MNRKSSISANSSAGYAIGFLFTGLLVVLVGNLSCSGRKGAKLATVDQPPPRVEFEDVTSSAGIEFRQTNGATGEKYLPETMGSGCAFLDYDNDGLLDILLVDGAPWTGSSRAHSSIRLYHNRGNGRFEDVTEQCGLKADMYAMGLAIGDFNNDGFEDIFVTGVGGCRLFQNQAGHRFVDVTRSAGVMGTGWATSATWIDYDRDGKLDLFVCHYVKWSKDINQPFASGSPRKTYSTPEQYVGETCRLYHNEGNGRFKDVTASSGIESSKSKALGAVAFDYDLDGWPDLVVTNDTQPNFLYHNQTDGTFKEVALEAGIAVSEMGKAKAGMGIDVADELGSGRESVAITNFSGEQLTLYRPDAYGHFLDEAAKSGIGTASQFYLGFGVFFFDFDGDGLQDLFVANGHIQGDVAARTANVLYREPALLLRNLGDGRFAEIASTGSSALAQPAIGRGAAWGDFDNDGHPDILLTSNAGDPEDRNPSRDGRARLLRNVNKTGNHWVRIRLEGIKSNRDAFGARVRVHCGNRTITQIAKCASGYLSQSDSRLLFGIGPAKKVDSIEIQWPSGMVQPLPACEVDRGYFVKEGSAAMPDPRGK